MPQNLFSKHEIEAIREALRGDEQGARNEQTVRDNFWAKVKRVGRNLPFAEDLVAAYYCTLDPATPNRVRLTLLAALAYFVMPFDAITDLLPLIGFADDAAVLAAAISQVAGAITDSHREKARAALADEDGPLKA
jgi:uncharacterized membrane protein YkvA (DUF1232 family)